MPYDLRPLLFPLTVAFPCLFLVVFYVYRRLHSSKDEPFSISLFSRLFLTTRGITLRPRLPTRARPSWLTIIIHPTEIRDDEYHLYFTTLTITCWFFPLTLRHKQSPAWFDAEFDDFTLRVYCSQRTPGWVQKLRNNLITTVLLGDILRFKELKTTVTFDSSRLVVAPTEEQETHVSVSTDGWIMRNWEPRLYNFQRVDAQLRRKWDDDTGCSSLAIVAKGCSWLQNPAMAHSHNILLRLLWEIIIFPWILGTFIFWSLPSVIDLRLTRADITFDAFRLRDAELVVRGGVLLRQQWHKNSGLLSDVGWGAFCAAVDGLLS